MTTSATHRAIEAIWRIESTRVIAGLVRILRDVGLAEEMAQEALLSALKQWPEQGVPENPGAWLMTTAKHRAIDEVRRRQRIEHQHQQLGAALADGSFDPIEGIESRLDDEVGDDVLRLMLISCHPVLSSEARVALTLRLVAGLTTGEIARAFLALEPTIAQRIVRAKRTLAEAGVPFEVPTGAELEARVGSVLGVLYLVFNEGYSATAGQDWMRPALCEEALRLGRSWWRACPGNRRPTVCWRSWRSRPRGSVPGPAPRASPSSCSDQNRARWDPLLIHRGLVELDRALELNPTPGPYTLQAAIAACHARARTAEETDWALIAHLYGELSARSPSPVVELNRAVAVGFAEGPAAALAIVDGLATEPSLAGYHLLPTVRGDLLEKLGRKAEARQEFERAAGLTQNAQERAVLLRRAQGCAG